MKIEKIILALSVIPLYLIFHSHSLHAMKRPHNDVSNDTSQMSLSFEALSLLGLPPEMRDCIIDQLIKERMYEGRGDLLKRDFQSLACVQKNRKLSNHLYNQLSASHFEKICNEVNQDATYPVSLIVMLDYLLTSQEYQKQLHKKLSKNELIFFKNAIRKLGQMKCRRPLEQSTIDSVCANIDRNPTYLRQIMQLYKIFATVKLGEPHYYAHLLPDLIRLGFSGNMEDTITHCTPLMSMIGQGNIRNVMFLIKSGLNINMRNSRGITPLLYAAYCGAFNIFDYLLCNGASVLSVTNHGQTILHYAARGGSLQIMHWLTEQIKEGRLRGMSVNVQDNDGHTPLSQALLCIFDDDRMNLRAINIAKYLLSHGAEPNISCTCHQYTPLHCAVQYNDIVLLEKLLNKGANVNAQNNDGDTPLIFVARDNDCCIDKLLLLLQAGADPNIQNESGDSPLMILISENDLEAAQLLLENRADVNLQNEDGDTALMIAVELGDLDAVNLLLDNNANIDIQNNDGNTAKKIALQKSNQSLINCLSQAAPGNQL